MACDLSDDVNSIVSHEIDEWLMCNTDGTVVLVEITDKAVDQCTVHLLLGSEYEVKLHVPAGYPSYVDSFLVEADSVIQTWTIAINEYLLDCQHKLSLCDVLDKTIELYSNKKSSIKTIDFLMDDDDEEEEEEEVEEEEEDSEVDIADVEDTTEDIADDEAFTTEWDLLVARKKMKWSKREPVVREMMKQKRLQQGLEAQNKTSQQIFTSNAASGILTNDLVKIMESEEQCGFSAEPIQDNIYHWRVRLSKFDPDSSLMKDLAEIKRRHGYDYIEMEMMFEIDLFPFYPPLVKVIRPRLQGCMMQRITNIELLQLSYWSPAKDMKSVIEGIKTFLQQWGRIDVDCDRNDLARCPYLDIEHHLLTLAQVSEVPPRANHLYKLGEEKIQELKSTAFSQSSKVKDSISKEEYWAKGVGFGHNNRPGWDINAYIAAQKERDNKIESALREILDELKKLPTRLASQTTPPSLSVPMLEEAGPSGECTNGGAAAGDFVSDIYSVLEGSALIPCIEHHLKVDSILEISRHSVVYSVIVNVIRELAYRKELLPLLCCLAGQDKSLFQLLEHLHNMASIMLKQIQKPANGAVPENCLTATGGGASDSDSDSSDDGGGDAKKDGYQCLNKMKKKFYRSPKPSPFNRPRAQCDIYPSAEEKLAREFIVLFKLVSHSVENCQLERQCRQSHNAMVHAAGDHDAASCDTTLASPPGKKTYAATEALYRETMKKLQFQSHEIPVEGKWSHHYCSQLSSNNSRASTKSQVIRIAQELSSLSSSLPLELSSSIFVQTDDEKISFMRALITGPEGTPYSSGCFVFDIYFPPNYPMTPPKVNLQTTGNGVVRFNPNLYNCGTVCLSLLGTWQGQNGEEWNEKTSTILQVLVSIQSLILVPDPYFNEPGYEQSINTDSGKILSEEYNKNIRIHCINHAMLHPLQHPPPGLEEVIKTHFYLKKDLILQEVKDWVKENKCSRLESAASALKKELKKLEPPPAPSPALAHGNPARPSHGTPVKAASHGTPVKVPHGTPV